MTVNKFSIIRIGLTVLLILPGALINAQTQVLTLEKAIETALENNLGYNSYKLKVNQNKVLKPTAFSLEKASVYFEYDQNNKADNGHPLNIIGVEQSISFPTVYSARYKVNNANVSISEKELEKERVQLVRKVSKAYYKIGCLMSKEYYYHKLDSLYKNLTEETQEKFKQGTADNLEVLNVKARHQQIRLSINGLRYDRSIAYRELMMLMNVNTPVNVPLNKPDELQLMASRVEENPGYLQKGVETEIQRAQLKLEKNLLLPDISLSLFNGTNRYPESGNYKGFSIGLSIPLFYTGQKARISAGKIAVSISKNEEESYLLHLKLRKEELINEMRKLSQSLDYYSTTGKQLSKELVQTASEDYAARKIDLYQFVQSLENATIIELEYLDWLSQYNDVVLDLNYLSL